MFLFALYSDNQPFGRIYIYVIKHLPLILVPSISMRSRPLKATHRWQWQKKTRPTAHCRARRHVYVRSSAAAAARCPTVDQTFGYFKPCCPFPCCSRPRTSHQNHDFLSGPTSGPRTKTFPDSAPDPTLIAPPPHSKLPSISENIRVRCRNRPHY